MRSGWSSRNSKWIRQTWRQQPGLAHALVLDTALPLVLGIVTLAGGWDRVAGNGWTTMREYGGPYFWGVVFLGLAVALPLVAWLANIHTLVWVLYSAAVIYGVAALWFFNAAVAIDSVSFWATFMCLYATANEIMRANIYRTADRYRVEPST